MNEATTDEEASYGTSTVYFIPMGGLAYQGQMKGSYGFMASWECRSEMSEDGDASISPSCPVVLLSASVFIYLVLCLSRVGCARQVRVRVRSSATVHRPWSTSTPLRANVEIARFRHYYTLYRIHPTLYTTYKWIFHYAFYGRGVDFRDTALSFNIFQFDPSVCHAMCMRFLRWYRS